MRSNPLPIACLASLILAMNPQARAAGHPGVVLEGKAGPGLGKNVVLVGGDEEYRSEEALPQLAQILAERHGFRCTVLFPIEDGKVNPIKRDNIPGLEALDKADLLVLFTRFRDLPDEQMKHIIDYVESGRPVIGLRTATHAFDLNRKSAYAEYTWNSKSGGGFGRRVLGETWVNHHGHHGKESTRGIIADKGHPITRGIKDGEIYGPTDVYTVSIPLPGDSRPLVLGQVLEGMSPEDKPVDGPKNNPMMPIAWVKSYTGQSGKPCRVFTTTMGASQDLLSPGLRRLLVNACYWATGLEDQIADSANVDLVGEYKPTKFVFGTFQKGRRPSEFLAR